MKRDQHRGGDRAEGAKPGKKWESSLGGRARWACGGKMGEEEERERKARV